MSARDEYLEMRREIRADMLRGCDTSTVHRCYYCGGTTSIHYEQPPECSCEPPEVEVIGARFFDEGDEP